MAYTVTKLITNAYFVSSIVSRDFQTVSGEQLNVALDFLNDILGDKSVDSQFIPYYTEYNSTFVIGQESYTIPGLILADTLTFTIGTVRYQTRNTDRVKYFGSSRANSVNALPFNWHIEKIVGGSKLYVYFLPDQAYPFQIWGQFGLTEVTLNTDLTLTYDRYYINYLRYKLAQRICCEYNFEYPMQASKQLDEYENLIAKQSTPMDLHLQKSSTLQSGSGLNYGQINIGHGWSTGNR